MRAKVFVCLMYVFATGVAAYAGTFSIKTFSGDADSGISTSNTYTHLVDFDPDGTPATVNNVTFTQTAMSGTNYTTSGLDYPYPGNTTSTGVAALTGDFFYNVGAAAGTVETVNLTGLTPGTEYDFRFYSEYFGPRTASVKATDGTTTDTLSSYSENDAAHAAGVPYEYLQYEYYPAGTTLSVSFTITSNGASTHFYGLTNQVVPEPAGLSMLAIGGLGLLRRRRS